MVNASNAAFTHSPGPAWFADFAQLFGKNTEHLGAILVPKSCRIAVKKRFIERFCAHILAIQAPGTSPVARACCNKAVKRSTSAAATRFPIRVSR